MTQERNEAAAQKFGELMGGGPTVGLDRHYSAQILAAADEVMFSNEAIERAAKAIFDIRDDPYDVDEWEDLDSTDRELYLCQARAVVAALKGEL